ncbi:MAG: aminotransferase class V-fold PLP-dependent enzyme [Lewinellaceae bacterium]|nr:aminotransferase class V-fold PLP-dependent enzyme [Saprospiraceae bacterium]MCB9331762.1 aminotransferase class V-fold PLP-dependent enzyme [Lewinellaceae bacterium]
MPSLHVLRAETPGCAHRNHLNNAGAALPPSQVLQVMQEHLNLEARIGGYEAADQVVEQLAGFYQVMAQLLNTDSGNIACATSATDAYARALSAIPWQTGDVILTTENDYVSNQIAFLALKKRFQVKLLRAKDSDAGGVDLDDMAYLIRQHNPVLVAVTHVPTNSGLVQPVEAIGKLCREHDCWYLVDACQSAGQMALDVQKIGCDFLSGTFRKFLRGPRGTGFLFVSDRVLEAGLEMLLPDMRSGHWSGPDTYKPAADARRFEYWEMSAALILGSKAAAAYALQTGMDWIEPRVRSLAAQARLELSELPGVRVLDQGADLCGIVTAYCADWEPRKLMAYLWDLQINARITPNYVARIDFPRKGIEWALRISPHYYNTEAEITAAVTALSNYPKS